MEKGETPEAYGAFSLPYGAANSKRETLVSNEVKGEDSHLRLSEVILALSEAQSMCLLSHTIMNTHTHILHIHTQRQTQYTKRILNS